MYKKRKDIVATRPSLLAYTQTKQTVTLLKNKCIKEKEKVLLLPGYLAGDILEKGSKYLENHQYCNN